MTIDVSSNTKWTASDTPEWISFSSSSGTGDATITIEVSPNTDYSSRSSVIKFIGINGTEQISASLRIEQFLTETIIIDGNTATVKWNGGTVEIPYQYTSVPNISIEGNPDWLKIQPTTKALSDGKVLVDVEKNDGQQRTATINFLLEDKLEQFIITQDAYIPVQSISFSQSSPMNLDANGSVRITPVFYPSDCSDKTLIWSSSNPDVATISEDGTVSVVSNGTTTIIATSPDGASNDLTVIVKIKATSISFVEWNDGNSWIPAGWQEIKTIQGSWGYEYIPQIQVYPENAYIWDMEMWSSNNMLVSVNGDKLICNDNQRSGYADITVSLPYSDVSATVTMEVKGYYMVAWINHYEQMSDGAFNVRFAGCLYTPNPSDEFTIDGVSIVDENNQVVAYGCTCDGNGTNRVKWFMNDYVNLTNYGMPIIDDVFYNRISQWKAIITFSNPKYQGIISESVNIDPRNQYSF